MGRKVKIGDIIEIETCLGFTYAQYTHKHASYGALLRVFSAKYQQRPESIECVLDSPVQFSSFFPLGPAIWRKIFEVVANLPINEELRSFPLFRAGAVGPSKKVAVWWLWDGETEIKIGSLTEEQKRLPIRGIINDTALIHRIETGWKPETDITT